MGQQASKIYRTVYQDGLLTVRLKITLPDDNNSYLSASAVSTITADVLQDVQYQPDNWVSMTGANGSIINSAISVPTTAILAEPVNCITDEGVEGTYNFEYVFGPGIFPLRGRCNMLRIRFNLTGGLYFHAPIIICEVI